MFFIMNMIKTLFYLPFYSFLMIITRKERKKLFKEDAKRWCQWKMISYSQYNISKLLAKYKEFRNLFYYRIGPYSYIVRLMFPGYDHLQITTPRSCIGGGLIIQHGFSTIISAKCIGKNCKIYQQVTIGYNHALEAPILGDNVEVCCGAKIIGGVRIGNNVIIGANAVVINDVPDNCVIAGVPAKIIKKI